MEFHRILHLRMKSNFRVFSNSSCIELFVEVLAIQPLTMQTGISTIQFTNNHTRTSLYATPNDAEQH